MSGQSIMDRVVAAKHSIAGQGLAKSVCKATTEEVMGPKKKHLDYLLQCTNEPNVSIPQLADLLIERTQHHNWVVVYKSLITIHNLMNYGNERFSQYLASNNCTFNLGGFLDKSGVQGYDMSTFIRRYAKYMNEKAYSYRNMAFDFCKVKRGKEDGMLRTMNTDKLLKTLPILQQQLDGLLEFDELMYASLTSCNTSAEKCSHNELTNGVINACFLLLFKDLIRLFACYNDGIINLLEKYFDMNKKQCKEALDLYKKFLVRMDKVSEFLKVAENVGIDKGDIPDLAKITADIYEHGDILQEQGLDRQKNGAPSSLLDALEQHLASLEGKKGVTTPTSRPSDFTTAVNSFASSVPEVNISEEEMTRLIEEENLRMQQLKEKRMKEISPASSPQGPPPPSSTNPFNTSSQTKSSPPMDLFGSPTKTKDSSVRPSDDLLALNSNPFVESVQRVNAIQTVQNDGFSSSATINGGTFTSDADFDRVFNNAPGNQSSAVLDGNTNTTSSISAPVLTLAPDSKERAPTPVQTELISENTDHSSAAPADPFLGSTADTESASTNEVPTADLFGAPFEPTSDPPKEDLFASSPLPPPPASPRSPSRHAENLLSEPDSTDVGFSSMGLNESLLSSSEIPMSDNFLSTSGLDSLGSHSLGSSAAADSLFGTSPLGTTDIGHSGIGAQPFGMQSIGMAQKEAHSGGFTSSMGTAPISIPGRDNYAALSSAAVGTPPMMGGGFSGMGSHGMSGLQGMDAHGIGNIQMSSSPMSGTAIGAHGMGMQGLENTGMGSYGGMSGSYGAGMTEMGPPGSPYLGARGMAHSQSPGSALTEAGGPPGSPYLGARGMAHSPSPASVGRASPHPQYSSSDFESAGGENLLFENNTTEAVPFNNAKSLRFDAFGEILKPGSNTSSTAPKQDASKLIQKDLDSSLAQLAGNLNMRGSESQVKKTDHQWNPKGENKKTGGANWQTPAMTAVMTFSSGYQQPPTNAPMMGYGQNYNMPQQQPGYNMGMQQQRPVAPGMGMAPGMAMAPGMGMPPANNPFMAPAGNQYGMQQPVRYQQPPATQANDPFGAL